MSLRTVLEQAGLAASVIELRFDGADRGKPDGVDEEMAFARALPLAKALDPDTLLAYELNGAPLPPEHGGPVRLVVPDWYGMASVKWLIRIVALEQPFDGYFQTTSYVLERRGAADPRRAKEPLQAMLVKSLITSPAAGDQVSLERQHLLGVAWSGAGAIVKVEVSVEGEGEWQSAELLGEALPHTWRQWRWEWKPAHSGRHALRVRATDEQGNTQPDVPEWNRLGYANNAIQLVMVEVSRSVG